jgi:membrane protease YdiL (CAAX protease family)
LTPRAFFVGADDKPHPPWRLLLFLVLGVACIIVVTLSLHPLLAGVERFTGIDGTAESYGTTIALLLAHWMTFRTYDQRPWSFVGLHQDAARTRVLAFGALVGAAPIAAASMLLVSVGLLALIPAPDGLWWQTALRVTVLLLPAAFYEELLSRGYLFATIREWLGTRAAVLVTSIGFGLLHLANPNVTATSIGLVILAGVYLAAVLLATRSLYAAWLAHWAWNWVMAALLHVPVSGMPLEQPDYQIVDAGPDWITGGQWGPEGGAAAAIAMIAGLGFLYWRSSRLSAFGSAREAESREPRTESPAQKAESREPRADEPR